MAARDPIRFLFIPVSSARGIGEYMRSLIIADGVRRRWPNAEIHFVISAQAPYGAQCPYATHLVNRSPTMETAAVNALINELGPHVVVFDASGRKAQLKCAKQAGARVIFISQHKGKRRRGMKIGRMRYTDLHWVAQPEFAIAGLSLLEKVKLALFKMSPPRHIGMVFTPPETERQLQLLGQYELTAGEYVLFSAGSGGHVAGETLAADIFASAAGAFAGRSGIPCVMVMGASYPGAVPDIEGVTVLSSLSNADFINLLDASNLAVLSGGGTLLQAIALKKPVLSVPIGREQAERVQACVARRLALTARLEANAMTEAIITAMETGQLPELRDRLSRTSGTNGLVSAIEDLAELGLA